MPRILIDNLSFSYSSTPLLENITMQVGDGERACIVGPNGCGKTTLLHLVRGTLDPDTGTVSTISSSGTDTSLSDSEEFKGTVGDYFHLALAPLRKILSDFEELTESLASDANNTHIQEEYDRLLALITHHDLWSLDARIDETLAGLGLMDLGSQGLHRSMDTLSPGQRGGVQLARTLIMRPEILILDEPTVHLDSDAISFLTQLLLDWSGPVLMTSHDRAFIDDVATTIYDLDMSVWNELAKAKGEQTRQGTYSCAGNYSDYVEAKEKARHKQKSVHQRQQNEKRQLQQHKHSSASIARGGVRLATEDRNVRKFFSDRAAKTATNRIVHADRHLESLGEREVRKPRHYGLSFEFPEVAMNLGIAVSIREAEIPGRLAPVTMDLGRGEHLLITGVNGAGKSTLLNWISTGYPPDDFQSRGSISRDSSLSFVPQALPTEENRQYDEFWDTGVGEVAKGIMHPSLWNTPMNQLSAGNRRRAQLAIALAQQPKLFIIDEPTNYLDLDTVEAFESACQSWNGTLIIASHDRWLIEHWQGRRIDLRSTKE